MQKVCIGAILGVLTLALGGTVQGNDDHRRVPASKVVWQLVGRTLLNPATGAGQVLGYFTFIEGVPSPMFAGAPGEATAYFTIRSQPFQTQFFPNGDILIGLLGDERFTVYADETPDQDFASPATFSDGTVVAGFNRLPAQINFVGPVFTDTFSVEFLSNRPITWMGRRVNLRQLTPNGVTLAITGSTTFQPTGLPDFPVSVAFGASAVAIESGERD